MKKKKISLRMCVSCREMKPKKDLVRIVKTPTNDTIFDRIGKAPGRGAYICCYINCLEKAIKSKAIDRALEQKITDDIFNELREELISRAT